MTFFMYTWRSNLSSLSMQFDGVLHNNTQFSSQYEDAWCIGQSMVFVLIVPSTVFIESGSQGELCWHKSMFFPSSDSGSIMLSWGWLFTKMCLKNIPLQLFQFTWTMIPIISKCFLWTPPKWGSNLRTKRLFVHACSQAEPTFCYIHSSSF
jgi:hypothetical protein